MAESSKSIWAWIGCGCFVLIVLGLAAIGAATWLGVKTVKTMADPQARLELALKTLSARALPAGYEIELVMEFPFYADLVVLDGDGAEFLFLQDMRTSADLRAAMTDPGRFGPELRKAGLQIGADAKVLATDELRLGAAQIRYMLVEGDVQFDLDKSQGDRSVIDFNVTDLDENDSRTDEAEQNVAFLLRCADSEDPGLGLWTREPTDEALDRDSLIRFLSEFGFCEA